MMRCLVLLFAACWLLGGLASADHVIVTGGPALRKWEDLRVEKDRHDRWWANFIRASTIEMDLLLKQPDFNDRLVWMVYLPAYRDRGQEDGKPYTTWIQKQATKRNAQLIWFSSGPEFIQKFNALPQGSVKEFEYFGHSNKHAFMFEYGSDIMAASTAWLHENDLGKLKRSVFSRDAVCTSWGCHTGESMSQVWERQLKVPLRGVRGPTHYSSVGRGELPIAKGPWTE
ncbi:MAG: hypothetical protein R3242_11585 [Akkermansiaceae bacterium]|nr:hypothetical protein [Akkermansiaceae bacterium]